QFTHQRALFVEQAAFGPEQQQLVGLKVNGRASGDVLAGQVEDFPGGRIAQRRKQHDAAFIELTIDALAVDAPHFAGVLVVDALDHADGPRGNEIAAGDTQACALHRRGGHVHGQARFDGDAQLADRVDYALQGCRVGDAQVLVKARRQPALSKTRFDLRARTVYQHQAYAETVQQNQVMDDIAEIRVGDAVAGQHDHEGAVAVGVDVGRGMAQPVDVFVHGKPFA